MSRVISRLFIADDTDMFELFDSCFLLDFLVFFDTTKKQGMMFSNQLKPSVGSVSISA